MENFSTFRSSGARLGRLVCVLVAFLLFAGSAMPSDAQTSDKLEELKAERRRVQEQAAEQARQVDVVNAEVDELTAALEALQTQVNAAQGRLDEAQRGLADAEARLAAAEAAVVEGQALIVELRQRLADRAIESFINQGEGSSEVLLEQADPNAAVRIQALVQNVSQSEADVLETLRSAEEDLRVQQALADVAAREAADLRDQVAVELVEVEDARNAQAAVTAEAESRLDAELAELASIKELDAELAAEISSEANRLAEELARKRRAATPPSGGGGAPSSPVGSGSIVSVRGIQVHQSIAANVEAMLAAAAADGISLSGGGYRSSDSQIRVRRNNCGTSNYAVYEMPASQCRPPTARPGSSQHEAGLAIDFTYNGRLIRSRDNAGFRWLAANAASYGFYNLPSEPWHWSTTGR